MQGLNGQVQNEVQSYEIFFPAAVRDEYDRHLNQRNTFYNKEHDDFETKIRLQKKLE
jgi:hypothetical protein